MGRRSRTPSSTPASFDVLHEMVGLIGGEFRFVVTLRGFIETLLARRQRVRALYAGTGGREVVRAIEAALQRDMVLGLSRILDDTNGADIASLPRALALIGSPTTKAAIEKRQGAHLRHVHHVEPAALIKVVQWHWKAAMQRAKLRGVIKGLRHNRHGYLAHRLLEHSHVKVRRRDVFRLTKDLVPVISDLCRLVGLKHHPFDGIYSFAKYDGRYFWSAITMHDPPPYTAPPRVRASA